MNLDPDSNLEIRPLKKGISRLVITLCLVVAGALALYASNSITTLRQDPEVRARVEAFERMKLDARGSRVVPDSSGAGAPDSTTAEPDSL